MTATSVLTRSRNLVIRFWTDRNIILFLFLIALCFRTPYLLTAPEYKGNELELTLQLLNGQRFPLYNQHQHIGALANYIVAGAFILLGRHYWVPQIVILLMGCLTVALLYPLGKKLIGKSASFLGSLMLAGSMYHIFQLSHLAWSNCMTPFFTLCFLLSFVTGLQFQKPFWLIFSGFLFGLSLQTHPSAITLVPFVICAFLLQGKEKIYYWLHRPAPYLMIVAAALGYANMIYFNIIKHAETIRHALNSPKYSLEENPGIQSYFHNSKGEWTLLLRLLSGAAEEKRSLIYYLQNPIFLVCTIALFTGILFCIRRKKWELPLLLAFPTLIIPVINKGYEFCKFGRYLGFLIPIACLLSAYGVVELCAFLRPRKLFTIAVTSAIWLILFVSYFGYHYDQLRKTYVELQRQDQSFFTFRQMRSLLKGYERHRTEILIDDTSWKENELSIFLESDGWNITKLTRNGSALSNEAKKKEVFLDSSLHLQMYDRLRNRPDLKILAIVSPLSLKSLFMNVPIAACRGCLASRPPDGTIYHQLINNVFYLFELGSEHATYDTAEDSLLTVLSEASRFLPDQPSDLKISKKQKIILPIHIKNNEAKSYIKRICKPAFVNLPEKRCRICPENLNASITWDHHIRRWSKIKNKDKSMGDAAFDFFK
jgi:Dolichyl-phosphate-mannose-protein mannosyltransferase